MFPLWRHQYCTQSSLCIHMREQMGTMWKANTGLWGPLRLNNTPKSMPKLFRKMWPKSLIKTARPDPSFANWISTLCILRDTFTAVEVSLWLCLLNERVHIFHNIGNWMVQTGFEIEIFWRVWRFCVKKHKVSLCNILAHWWVEYLRNCNLQIPLQNQLLWQKFCKGAECNVRKNFWRCMGDQFFCKRVYC